MVEQIVFERLGLQEVSKKNNLVPGFDPKLRLLAEYKVCAVFL